jgi:hypothetical protein
MVFVIILYPLLLGVRLMVATSVSSFAPYLSADFRLYCLLGQEADLRSCQLSRATDQAALSLYVASFAAFLTMQQLPKELGSQRHSLHIPCSTTLVSNKIHGRAVYQKE